jgi:Cu2+-exporting ATPase
MIALREQLEDAAPPPAPRPAPPPGGDTAVACDHCGLTVPRGELEPGAERQFCCGACRAVFGVIHACGLDGYYRLRKATEESLTPARAAAGSRDRVSEGSLRYAEFDDPAFARLHTRQGAAGLSEAELHLEGVHCAACVWLVEKLPMILPGVAQSRLEFRRAIVRLAWDPHATTLSRIGRALESLGYIPHAARGADARESRRREDRRFMIRIAIAGAAAGNVMLLAFALYAAESGSAGAGSSYSVAMQPLFHHLFRWLSTGIGVLSLAWPGSVFFRGAWAAIRTRTAHLDIPIALGLGAGGLWGAVNTIRGRGEIYFDSLTVLVFLLLVARWVQLRQQRRAADSIELLYSLTPSWARRIDPGGRVHRVPIEALAAGDRVEVLAGDSAPVDGVVLAGASRIDQSLLTGESAPLRVEAGDPVPAGAVNLSAPLTLAVHATGPDTRIGRLMRLVEQCAARRAPIVQLADRLAIAFVVAVTSLAAFTLALWLWLDARHAADHAVAVLIVTCPCALSLATPLALTIAIGRCARRGILIKGGDVLERLSRAGVMYLDKTGTITTGSMTVVRWTGDESVKPLAAALESASSHPIALAIHQALTDGRPRAVRAEQRPGSGIAGTVDGRAVAIGSIAFISGLGASVPAWAHDEVRACAALALTPVCIAAEGVVTAIAGVGDPIRPDAATAIAGLRAHGWDVRILSGDHPGVVAAVGRQLGLDPVACRGGASPEDKLRAVQGRSAPLLTSDSARAMPLSARRPVVMVGDGVNDAAALSAADVGIAVHGGAEASLAAADLYLSTPGLEPIVALTGAARRTLGAIRRCIAISLLYNAAAASLAVGGFINPIAAAVIMPASSFTVLAIVYRARTFTRIGPTRGRPACP